MKTGKIKMEEERYQLTCNKERIDFLYSAFPADKSLNPKHWDSKIQFWSTEIDKCGRFYGDACMSCQKLQRIFQHPETKRSPKGLLTILTSLYESGQILLMHEVTDLSQEQSWSQWSLSIAYKMSRWAWQKLVTGLNEDTEFLQKDLLEEQANALLDFHYKTVQYEKTDHVVPWNVLKNVYKINKKSISEKALVYIIGYLKYTGRCKIGYTEENERIVKFKSKAESKVDPVCQNDFEIINLKKTIAKLTLECKTIENELHQLKVQAQVCLKNKDRTQAKKILILRQKSEKKLQTKHDALFAMKDHLGIVRDAETTKLITNAFNSSATLLNNTYKEQGLTVDNVENVIDKASEANEMAREVSNALSTGLKQMEEEEFDMDELEQELAELNVDHLGPSSEEAIPSFGLPQVPTHSPGKTSTPTTTKPKVVRRREMEMAS